MKCPHCLIAFHDEDLWERYEIETPEESAATWVCLAAVCPICKSPIIKLVKEALGSFEVIDKRVIYPASPQRAPVGNSVPEGLRQDYLEACQVLPLSAKASAALSRRVLQAILTDRGYARKNLSEQIDAVLNESDRQKALPLSLREMIDAIRQFGNFSAHPITDITSLQIIDVEPEEAEWCLEIIEGLFDHYYVKPADSRSKRAALNKKLIRAGKPPAKS